MQGSTSPESFSLPVTLLEPTRLVWPVAWAGHIPFAYWITSVLKPRHFVELGTHIGNSYCSFLQAAHYQGLLQMDKPPIFRAIDHWQGDEHAGIYGDEIFDDLLNFTQAKYGSSAHLMRMSFDEALPHIKDGSVDLLHIDGLHTYDAVQHDFESWLPKLSQRGVVLLHDTQVKERGFGVYRLLDELKTRFPVFDFAHSHGLGVVAVGPEQPEPIMMLINQKSDVNGVSAQSYFGAIGEGITNKFLLSRIEGQIEVLTNERDQYLEIAQRAQERPKRFLGIRMRKR